MNIFIIEDETPALNRIRKLILELVPDAVIAGTTDSIESAVKWYGEHPHPDLTFMDIELADGQSFEIFNRVEVKCPVIFTTAYDEFALRAFKVNSIDYLLKPVEQSELKKAMDKFYQIYRSQTTTDYRQQFQDLLSNLKHPDTAFKNRFLIKSGAKLISVSTTDIAYFHAAEKMVYVFTHQNQKYIVDYSLDELGKMLDPKDFFHLNRQFIASLKSIGSIHTYFNGKLKVELVTPMNEEVIVSREKAAEFKEWLDS